MAIEKVEIYDRFAGKYIDVSVKQVEKYGSVEKYLLNKYHDRERKSGTRAGTQKPLPDVGKAKLEIARLEQQQTAQRAKKTASQNQRYIAQANARMRALERRGLATAAYQTAVARLEIAHRADIQAGTYTMPRFRAGDLSAAMAFLNSPSSTITGMVAQLDSIGVNTAGMSLAEMVVRYEELHEIAQRTAPDIMYNYYYDIVQTEGKPKANSKRRKDDRRLNDLNKNAAGVDLAALRRKEK